jgi:hypothetical protein
MDSHFDDDVVHHGCFFHLEKQLELFCNLHVYCNLWRCGASVTIGLNDEGSLVGTLDGA